MGTGVLVPAQAAWGGRQAAERRTGHRGRQPGGDQGGERGGYLRGYRAGYDGGRAGGQGEALAAGPAVRRCAEGHLQIEAHGWSR